MRKMLVLLVALMMLSGCAGTLPTASYLPQNYEKLAGETSVGSFTYQPFTMGKVKANQIQNTAIGQIYLSTNVAEFVKRGTALELEKSGVVLNENSPIAIQGNVIEFMMDDLGYSIDLKYSIEYKIIDKTTQKVLFQQRFTAPQKKIGKFGSAETFVTVASEMVLSGYELFARDPKVKSLLNQHISISDTPIK